MRALITILGFLTGCGEPDEPAPPLSYIAPIDGQTGIPTDLPLLLAGAAAEIPPDYPLARSLLVVDLETGGFVSGTFDREGDDLLFAPNEPWHENRRYAWGVDPESPEAHGPETPIPENLLGTAVFDTTSTLDVLGAALDGERACLVISQVEAPFPADVPIVTVDDVPIEGVGVASLRSAVWDPGYPRLDGDPYIDVWCIIADASIPAGADLRIWWGDFGPWHLSVSSGTVKDLIVSLHRGSL